MGTRGSQLARWQAQWIAGALRRLGHSIELVEITTRGDADRLTPVEEIGTRGVFTKEIQRALLDGAVDLGVHSLKDLPTEPVDGLVLAAVPERESPADVFVVGARNEERGTSDFISSLAQGARVGTGSLRRQAQLLHVRPDLRVTDVRGNVDTRLRKLDDGQFDAIVLAEAGLRRLSLDRRISQVLPFEIMLPAVGQGALGIECRSDDDQARAILAPLEDVSTRAAVAAERALLQHLRGGCMAPIGALGRVNKDEVQLSAVVLSADGAQRLAASGGGAASDAEAIGRRVAEDLLGQGAAELIALTRNNQYES